MISCFPKRLVNFIYHHRWSKWGIPRVTDILDWIPYLICRTLVKVLHRNDVGY
jgi:hypothetical protein